MGKGRDEKTNGSRQMDLQKIERVGVGDFKVS